MNVGAKQREGMFAPPLRTSKLNGLKINMQQVKLRMSLFN